jgi:hypothetical protein
MHQQGRSTPVSAPSINTVSLPSLTQLFFFCRRHRLVVEEALLEATGAQRVVWRTAAFAMEGLGGGGEEEEEGSTSDEENWEAEAEAEAEAATETAEEVYEDVQVLDCGVKYMVGLMSQKTGFYCDQRDSRKLIREYSAGKYVCTSRRTAYGSNAKQMISASSVLLNKPAVSRLRGQGL